MLLEKHSWKAHIRVDIKIKIRLYRTYVLWVLMYGSKSWMVVKTLVRRLYAFGTEYCVPDV